MHSGKCGGCGSNTPSPSYEMCESCSYPSGGIITGCTGCNDEVVIKDVLTLGNKIIVTYTSGVVKQYDFCPSCQTPIVYNRPNNEPLIGDTELGVADYFTAEHRTGAKWIDGKDIYRKVILIPSLSVVGDGTINYLVSNIAPLQNSLISYTPYIKISTTDGSQEDFISFNPERLTINIATNVGFAPLILGDIFLNYNLGVSNSYVISGHIIIEYTK